MGFVSLMVGKSDVTKRTLFMESVGCNFRAVNKASYDDFREHCRNEILITSLGCINYTKTGYSPEENLKSSTSVKKLFKKKKKNCEFDHK